MRHRKAGRKLGRTTAHREMLLRNLLTSLFHYEKIVTTEAKAKELRKLTDKVITLAKRGDLHARRQAAEVIEDGNVLKKLFDSIGGRYKDRNGGYTRMTKLEYRMGDGAPLAAIELVEVGAGVEPPANPARRRGRRGDKGKAPTSGQTPRPAHSPGVERAAGA
ncbi:MAG: 50S ribosomal protein L17 [candidate division NC10 bacterium]|nr:50S ribosomal protein L17 [candidate division NC10 bacterium]MDE2320929.1 50S ribosomal protein L17 [candidate division NC10 bacterium]